MIDAGYIRQLCREHGTNMTTVSKKMYPLAKQPLSQLSTALRGNPRLDWLERLAKAIGCETGALLTPLDDNRPKKIACPKCGHQFHIEITIHDDIPTEGISKPHNNDYLDNHISNDILQKKLLKITKKSSVRIPITEEILKNNGFKSYHQNYEFCSDNGMRQISVGYETIYKIPFEKEEDKYVSIWFENFKLSSIDIASEKHWICAPGSIIRYVHELEYALHLCGIEKKFIVEKQ